MKSNNYIFLFLITIYFLWKFCIFIDSYFCEDINKTLKNKKYSIDIEAETIDFEEVKDKKNKINKY